MVTVCKIAGCKIKNTIVNLRIFFLSFFFFNYVTSVDKEALSSLMVDEKYM